MCMIVYVCMDMQVENKEDLGEWVGLCKIDKDGKPRKVVKCSCVVIKVGTGDGGGEGGGEGGTSEHSCSLLQTVMLSLPGVNPA